MKGVLLQKVLETFPDMDVTAINLMSHLKSCCKSLTDELTVPMAEHGLSEGKFYTLVYLYSEELLEHESPSPSDIADNIEVTRATITGLLDGLERDGLVLRRHSQVDRRAITITLTDKGRTLLQSFCPAQSGRITELLSPLSADEKATLIRLLAKIDPQAELLDPDR